jgi:anti-anti-sigma factor
LEIATRRYADAFVAVPMGRVDHLGAPRLEAALSPLLEQAADARGALVLDFSGVDYISSVGLRVLMIASSQLRSRQAKLVVAGLQAVVAEIFAISRFDRVLLVAATLEDALGHCSPAALASYRQAGTTP